MKQNILIGTIVVVLLTVYSSMFTVHMTQSAVVLELQKPKEIISEPGLYFKVPGIQQVRFFSNQLLVNDSPSTEVITKDKKNLLIDNFSMWRITDPLKFLETVRSTDNARSRLDDILYSEVRVEIGTHILHDIITEAREKIMARVTEQANLKASEYGIEVVEVRIKRTDLPPEIANSIFNRMRTERDRIAKEYRSEGKEEATKIRAKTDKEKTILIAEAYEREQTIRGEGDAKSIAIYADAFKREPGFYSFMRSMEAYKNSFASDTTILLSENSEFLEFMNKPK
ncbi:MAG: protease modulator HflC [Candidatus Nitrohelix vancouverensis]|uniref:Protein HflC n=1 Tax=Candidatus Nitrohelix vancouverensis TaxID=2705534 RepID=A0A7T0C1S5_9BACT|nr:MAG: protease modulator HflC [Candidatus Nitrohelix vancouverensis]